ncbi:MAG: TonB-dependent receptor, partial [Armatimonadota bacterium]|nr:TonB-dependent receptor [Armatimonadota bacterium]
RSFGDTQVGSTAGEQGTREFELSHLQEAGHRRGVRGLTVERQETDGVRANADVKSDRFSLVFGQKAQDKPLGVYLLGQFERRDLGADTGEVPSSSSANTRREDTLPRLLAGFNLQSSERRQTRALLQYMRPKIEITDPVMRDPQFVDYNSVNMEVRHDQQIGTKSILSAGFSAGNRRRHIDALLAPDPRFPEDPFIRTLQDARLRAYQVYVRDEVKANERLTLMGEMQLHRLTQDRVLQEQEIFTESPPIVGAPQFLAKATTVGLPNFIATYRPHARSGFRFRARRLFGAIDDFRLLAPTDVFLFSFTGLPNLNLFGRGRSFELEYDRTFRDASFLRLGVFDQRLTDVGNTGISATIPFVRQRGVRASYEGFFRQDTTYFVNLNLTDAKDVELNQDVEQVPGRSGEVGVQYLNRQGWFVQPSFFYLGNRIRSRSAAPQLGGNGITRLGGVGLLNLRAGKRWGLRSVLFVEIDNALDKQYAVLGTLQPGRAVRLGVTQRF